jgi:hypothetical protein
MQPVQHDPLWQTPPGQLFPSQQGVVPHEPPVHVAFAHGVAEQVWQASPLSPHLLTVFPGSQLPSQHPVQQDPL